MIELDVAQRVREREQAPDAGEAAVPRRHGALDVAAAAGQERRRVAGVLLRAGGRRRVGGGSSALSLLELAFRCCARRAVSWACWVGVLGVEGRGRVRIGVVVLSDHAVVLGGGRVVLQGATKGGWRAIVSILP